MVLICRLCLKSYPKSRPELIFSVNARDQNGLAVTTLIKTLVPEVYLGLSDDPLVCHICYKTLYDAYSFRLKCLRSENLIGIYMREQDTLSTTTNIRLDDVIAYWMNMYCTKRGASDIAKENLVEWFGIHVVDDQIGSETSECSNKSNDLHSGDETATKIDESMSKFVKILPAPTPKAKTVEEISSDDLVETQNVIPPKKSTNTEDDKPEKVSSKSKEENKCIKSLLEKDPLENAAPEEKQLKVVSIKQEIVEDQGESEKSVKQPLNEDSVVTPEPDLTPLSEEPVLTPVSISDKTLTTSDTEMDQPLLKLRKVTTLKKHSTRPNYVKIKTLRPIGTRRVGRPFKKNSNFLAGGYLKVKSSDLQPLLLDKSLMPDQILGEEPGTLLRPVTKNSGNLLSKPGTKLMALTVDQLNAFLKSNNMVPVATTSLSPEIVTAETAPVLEPDLDPPIKPVVKETKTSQRLEETSNISEPTVKVKQEPMETSKEATSNTDSQDANSSEEWEDGETVTASETSLVDRLLDADMPVLGDYEFDQPEYVSVTQVTNWEDMPMLEPAMLAEKVEEVLPSKMDETSEQSLATRIKEQIKVKMTAAKHQPVKRVAVKESADEPASKKLKVTPKPDNVAQIPEQQEINDEPKDICVLYTKFTNDGHYMNDHDYLISPYLRNNMITYRSGRRMCMCLLCDSSHPDSNHVKHMKYHSTKCIICNADFKNVFILNLHVRGHTKRCFECEVNVTYARYHHHEKVHPFRVLKNEQARQEEEQAEADSILKVLLAEKVDVPSDMAGTSQSKRNLRSRRGNKTATKTRNVRKRAPRKKAEEITLMDLLNSSVKPDASNLDLEQLSTATQKTPNSSNTAEESVKKPTRRRKKKFLLGRRKKATKYSKKKIKTETEEDDEFQIEYFPLQISEAGPSDDVKPKVESKPVVRRRQTRRRTPRKSISPTPKVEIEEVCKDPLSFDPEEVTEADFSNIPVKSSLLFETMTPIKIVKMESNKIVVTPIGPVMTVRPTSPFQKPKRRKTASTTSDVQPKSRFDTLIEETERHIREARSLRKSLTLKANLRKRQATKSTRVISTGEPVPILPLEVPSQEDVDGLNKLIKQEVDPLS